MVPVSKHLRRSAVVIEELRDTLRIYHVIVLLVGEVRPWPCGPLRLCFGCFLLCSAGAGLSGEKLDGGGAPQTKGSATSFGAQTDYDEEGTPLPEESGAADPPESLRFDQAGSNRADPGNEPGMR